MSRAVDRWLRPALSPLAGIFSLHADAPWRARTVLLALVIGLFGVGSWIREAGRGPAAGVDVTPAAPEVRVTAPADGVAAWDFSRPLPGSARVSASYIGGFLIGWIFRRIFRLVLALGAVALAVVGLGKQFGWDTTPVEQRVNVGTGWVTHKAERAEGYLRGLLPSASAGGAGAVLGWRRRRGAAVGDAPATEERNS